MHNRNHWGMGIAYLTYLFYFKTARISMMSMALSPLHGKKTNLQWKKCSCWSKNICVGWCSTSAPEVCHRHLLEFGFKLG